LNETILRVQMLGELTLTLGEKKISEGQNRSKKMWALLAYLLYHRHRTVTQDELLELLWGSGSGHNPVSAMKTAMHRTRALMDDLSPAQQVFITDIYPNMVYKESNTAADPALSSAYGSALSAAYKSLQRGDGVVRQKLEDVERAISQFVKSE